MIAFFHRERFYSVSESFINFLFKAFTVMYVMKRVRQDMMKLWTFSFTSVLEFNVSVCCFGFSGLVSRGCTWITNRMEESDFYQRTRWPRYIHGSGSIKVSKSEFLPQLLSRDSCSNHLYSHCRDKSCSCRSCSACFVSVSWNLTFHLLIHVQMMTSDGLCSDARRWRNDESKSQKWAPITDFWVLNTEAYTYYIFH